MTREEDDFAVWLSSDVAVRNASTLAKCLSANNHYFMLKMDIPIKNGHDFHSAPDTETRTADSLFVF